MNTVKNKVTGGGVPKFKAMTEDKVEESTLIPKVNPEKDFKEYQRKLKEARADIYHKNHPPKPEE